MQILFPPFASLALHKGDRQNLQLVGLGTDGSIGLPAWQSHTSGAWTIQQSNPLSFQTGTFSALALGTGNSGFLQVLALGMDQHIYLAAWQDGAGNWRPPETVFSGPFGDAARRYKAVTAFPGNGGFLQVFGLSTDGKIYLVNWQDEKGHWHPPGAADTRPLGEYGRNYSAMIAAAGNNGNLQVLGLGVNRQIYRVAWQDNNGGWHHDERALSTQGRSYSAVSVENGNNGFLQVVGLGTDQNVYLAAWQGGSGEWNREASGGAVLGIPNRPYTAVATHIGADNNLQVVCIGADGKAYLQAYQDQSGFWHAPSSANAGPLGNPATTYQALTMANGDGGGKHSPGRLQLVGLGSGEAGNGLPYLAAWQSEDGHWTAGMPLNKVRSPSVNWEMATGQTVEGGCVAFGRLWVAQGSSVISFDAISGAPGRKIYPFHNNASPRAIQPHGDSLAIVCDDGNLYLADPDTGTIASSGSVGIPTWMATHDGAVYVAGFGGLSRLGPDGTLSRPYGPDMLAGAPTISGNVLYVPIDSSTFGSHVQALDTTTLSRLWSVDTDGSPGAVFCDGAKLCFITSGHSLYVVDVGSRLQITPNGKPIALGASSDIQPILNGNTCYVAFNDAVQAIDVITGEARRRFGPIRTPGGTPLQDEKGTLFYITGNQILSIDTASSSEGVTTYDTGNWPLLVAHKDGALFYAATDVAASIRPETLIRQYYAESCLIRDFDFSDGVAAATSTPSFQLEVALSDEHGAPRAGQTVRITATAATTLSFQGRSAEVSKTRFLDVVTDGAGRFRVSVPAGSMDRGGTFWQGLTAPELLLTSPFMDTRMRFVIRPHGKLQQQLATITPQQLQCAKGYDEQPVVAETYRNDSKAMADATNAINQTASMVRISMADPRKRSPGNMYCDPACDTAVACCMPTVDPVCRILCDQSFAFDLSLGASDFRLLSNQDARIAAAALLPQAALGDWDDFWDQIKSGAAKVTGAVLEAVADGAKATIRFTTRLGASIVEGVIGVIEQATLLLQGIFNTIVTAIHRVVEAVSFLFDWGKIIDLHDEIRERTMAAWSMLATGTGGIYFENMKTTFDSWFQTAAEKVDHAFERAEATLGVQTPLAAQVKNSKKPNPAVDSSQDNWLLAKCQDNVLPSGATNSIIWPELELGQDVHNKFDSLIARLGTSLSDEAKATVDRIGEMLNTRSGAGPLARGFASILEVMHGVAKMAITIGQEVSSFLIDFLQAIIAAAYKAMTATVEIPYVSDFYYWATKRKLTLIDLFALVTAIPAGFALKLVGREPAYASGVSPLPPTPTRTSFTSSTLGWMEIVAGCAQAVWGLLSGILSVLDLRQVNKDGLPLPGSGQSAIGKARLWLTLIFGVSTRAAFLMPLTHDPSTFGWLTWGLPSAILACDIGYLRVKQSNPDVVGLVAAAAGLLGVLQVVLGITAFVDQHQSVDEGLGLGFVTCVGVSMVARGVVGIGAGLNLPQVQYMAILTSALLLVVSGGFEIARGARQVDATEEAGTIGL
ncbi:PQQ-binding-like beta-propeller repeat protein [Burkholderia vietnamiensis]|uniref:outer membrane protein assembly factor BamB family protein n=1 Tax=Burkholderia vietnamiensis TaxID=60552 RepID=UPI00075EAED3|nr:PQQ-binding-like beta-propeller repeat protein [Burkholderia vietnamiensis]KVR85610.1 hypothetical protein WK26_04925 [Burkholderia vietnamiensis]KVS39316.1 hypothetical protein WK35_27990 [Burkholderia vietnamiensis]MBR8036203.1 hypothetical protein [Burkholderia vietnamiensis]MBR8205969.1 hypothetical protein [Burkholderia vietnamiensis]MCA8394986.1 PQQ-like beta-propeller repeat protein [Burkholderia vietnamiensis]